MLRCLPARRTSLYVGKRLFRNVVSADPLLDTGNVKRKAPQIEQPKGNNSFSMLVFCSAFFFYLLKLKSDLGTATAESELRSQAITELETEIKLLRAKSAYLRSEMDLCRDQLKE